MLGPAARGNMQRFRGGLVFKAHRLAALLAMILTALPLLGAQNTGYPGFWLYGDEYDTSHSGQQDVVSLLVDTVPACALLAPPPCTISISLPLRADSRAGLPAPQQRSKVWPCLTRVDRLFSSRAHKTGAQIDGDRARKCCSVLVSLHAAMWPGVLLLRRLCCLGLAPPLARQPDQGSLPGHGAGVGGGVRIHPENARMSGRHGV